MRSLVVIVVAGCGGPPESVPSTAPPAPRAAAPSAPAPTIARSCATPFEVRTPYPDTFVDQAAAVPAVAAGAWSTAPMTGPAVTFASAAPGCTEVARLPAAPPFDEIIECSTGNRKRPLGYDNVASFRLAVRTVRGWWAAELVHEYWPHGDPEDNARVARVTNLAAADRVGDGGVEVTAITEDGPPGDSATRTLVICGTGASAGPSCARIQLSTKGPFHGAGARQYRLVLGCDGAIDLAGWEGGARVGLVHGRYSLAFP